METSLRYGGDSKSLKIYVKEKYPVATNAIFQLNGELDTRIGAPTYVNAMIRRFFPTVYASLGVGVQYDRNEKLPRKEKLYYNARAKKSFPVTYDESVSFNLKARCVVDDAFRKYNYRGDAEFTWNILNFKKEQDLRVKFGYDLVDKIPYLQIRENNWTFNTDGNRKWNVRYDL